MHFPALAQGRFWTSFTDDSVRPLRRLLGGKAEVPSGVRDPYGGLEGIAEGFSRWRPDQVPLTS